MILLLKNGAMFDVLRHRELGGTSVLIQSARMQKEEAVGPTVRVVQSEERH